MRACFAWFTWVKYGGRKTKTRCFDCRRISFQKVGFFRDPFSSSASELQQYWTELCPVEAGKQ